MDKIELIGISVDLTVSDPWEFGTECGIGPFRGTITDADDDRILIRLEEELHYQGKELNTVISRPRHYGDDNRAILSNGRLAANMLLMSAKFTVLGELTRDEAGCSIAVIGAVDLA